MMPAIPLVRPPDVSQPDLALSRFFAAHRPLLDIELLGSAGKMAGSKGSANAFNFSPPAAPAPATSLTDAAAAEAQAAAAATDAHASSSSLFPAASAPASSAGELTSDSAQELLSALTSSSTSHPGIHRTSIIVQVESAAADDQDSTTTTSSSVLSATRIGAYPLVGQQEWVTAHLRNETSSRSLVIPHTMWKRKPTQLISVEHFSRLMDELSSGDDVQSTKEQEEKEDVKDSSSSSSVSKSNRTATSSSIISVPSSARLQSSPSIPTSNNNNNAQSNLTSQTRPNRPSPKVLAAAIELLARDAYQSSRDAAIARALERGESTAVPAKLGVESELVILGEQGGPSVEWARGAALWLAENGRAYWPPAAPSSPQQQQQQQPERASRTVLEEGRKGRGRGLRRKLMGRDKIEEKEEQGWRDEDDMDIVISDPETLVNVSLMDAENALGAQAVSAHQYLSSSSAPSGHHQLEFEEEMEDEEGGEGEIGFEDGQGAGEGDDLVPADPTLLLSHALVQARLSESLESANALMLLNRAMQTLNSEEQGEGKEARSTSTSTSTSVSAVDVEGEKGSLRLLDLSSLNATLTDIRTPALGARARQARMAAADAAASSSSSTTTDRLSSALASVLRRNGLGSSVQQVPVRGRSSRRRGGGGGGGGGSGNSPVVVVVNLGGIQVGEGADARRRLSRKSKVDDNDKEVGEEVGLKDRASSAGSDGPRKAGTTAQRLRRARARRILSTGGGSKSRSE
ncbi:unnamed protein product [Tilletia controversa]|nr:unnamed protein product [Tilletia controversa]CAD6970919.1 unnamed protein product [Tilletia controversa]